MNLSDKIYYLKKSVQILLPLSIFSFLVLNPQSYSSLHHSYDQFLSKFSSKNMVEKNFIFLVFNGILVLIISASGLITIFAPMGPTGIPLVQDQRPKFDEEHKLRIAKEVKDGVEVKFEEEEEEKEEDDNDDDHQDHKEKESEEPTYEVQEDGTDEFHKKCDDFIRKARQEIFGL